MPFRFDDCDVLEEDFLVSEASESMLTPPLNLEDVFGCVAEGPDILSILSSNHCCHDGDDDGTIAVASHGSSSISTVTVRTNNTCTSNDNVQELPRTKKRTRTSIVVEGINDCNNQNDEITNELENTRRKRMFQPRMVDQSNDTQHAVYHQQGQQQLLQIEAIPVEDKFIFPSSLNLEKCQQDPCLTRQQEQRFLYSSSDFECQSSHPKDSQLQQQRQEQEQEQNYLYRLRRWQLVEHLIETDRDYKIFAKRNGPISSFYNYDDTLSTKDQPDVMKPTNYTSSIMDCHSSWEGTGIGNDSMTMVDTSQCNIPLDFLLKLQ